MTIEDAEVTVSHICNLKTVNVNKALQGGSSIIDLPFYFSKL